MRCLECGCRADDGKGWRAYLVDDPNDDEEPYVVVYCPACAQREFGALRSDANSLER